MDRDNFQKQLERQMIFLRNSCEIYDNGFHDEAIRIATTLRVLIHNTRSSKSLLSHLEAEDININASPGTDPEVVMFSSKLTEFELKIHTDKNGNPTHEVRQLPLGIEGLCRSIPLMQWWNEPIMKTMEGIYTRKDLILWAANKGGGAHVDASFPALYSLLVDGKVSSGPAPEKPGLIGFYIDIQMGGKPPEGSKVLPNAHFSDLRQMATEFMTSPDVLKLMPS